MSMETGARSSAAQPRRQVEGGQSQIVVVEIGEPQSPVNVSHLRKGKGKLFKDVERIVNDLITNGTIKFNVQPIVIVVHEHPFAMLPSLWTRDDDRSSASARLPDGELLPRADRLLNAEDHHVADPVKATLADIREAMSRVMQEARDAQQENDADLP
jgi:hypothetical protein